jgi:hypothetical protein
MFASVPASPCGPAEDAKWSRGMAMSMKEKLLFLWLLAVVVFSPFLHHFWSIAMEALGKVLAMNLFTLPALAKFMAGLFGLFFLP